MLEDVVILLSSLITTQVVLGIVIVGDATIPGRDLRNQSILGTLVFHFDRQLGFARVGRSGKGRGKNSLPTRLLVTLQ